MRDKIIEELDETVEKFDNDVYILNTEKIRQDSHLHISNFEGGFSQAMHEYKIASRPTGSDIEFILKIEYKTWKEKWQRFHYFVTTAKTLDLFIDKPMRKELEQCKQRCDELDIELRGEKTENENLRERIAVQKAKLEIYERDTPKYDTLEGDINSG